MLIQLGNHPYSDRGPVLLQAGFRPFFLLAGLAAMLMVPLWLAQVVLGWRAALTVPPLLWHGHEMVFGFATAAVAGFLLTAVPNWTGAATVRGLPLALLAALWLAARIGFWAGLPVAVVAVPDLLFLPALGLALARPLIRAGKPRNMMFLGLLALLDVADAVVLAAMAGHGDFGLNGLLAAIFILLFMIAVIGGRIIPGFTRNGLHMIGVTFEAKARPGLDKAALLALLAGGLLTVVPLSPPVAGLVLAVAALLHGARLAGWGGRHTARVPLLWILHLGYAWLPLGLALLALSDVAPDLVPMTIALHALTAGTIASMILGVMTRAALGHSGRPLKPHALTVAAYALVQLAALARVAGCLIDMRAGLMISGLLWTLAFLLFLVVYGPICLAARADGR